MVTGVVPSRPRCVPSFLSRRGFSVPAARQWSSNFANLRSRTYGVVNFLSRFLFCLESALADGATRVRGRACLMCFMCVFLFRILSQKYNDPPCVSYMSPLPLKHSLAPQLYTYALVVNWHAYKFIGSPGLRAAL